MVGNASLAGVSYREKRRSLDASRQCSPSQRLAATQVCVNPWPKTGDNRPRSLPVEGHWVGQLAEAKYHFQQGLTFATVGRIDEGIQEFNAAIDRDPTYAAAYGNRGMAYMLQKKKYNKALDDLNSAIRLDPKDRNAFYNLAALRTLRQEFDLAIDALDQALKRGFNNYESLRRDADLEGLRGQPEFRRLLERHKISL
jgi:tetratricopeptide (TPR) repeat protein